MRKQYTAKQKAQIVLEILKEELTIAQIASQYGIHPNQLYKWKAQAREGLPGLLEEGRKTDKPQWIFIPAPRRSI
jgi:transposase-like protein